MSKTSLKRNYIYNLIYQLLIVVIPLITTPYVSRVLGADGVGIYSYTLSITTYFILFGTLGIAMYGQREIAYIRDNTEECSKTFFEILILRFITMAVSIFIFIILYANGNEYSIYYKILILELLANAFDISWFFQGLEEFKKTVTRNIIVKIISVLCIFIFVKSVDDLWKYILIYVLSNLIGNLSLWLYLTKYVKKIRIKKLDIKKHILPTISLFIPQIAMQIYLVLDKTMLGNILGEMSEIGNYEQSQKIVKTVLTIVTALGTVVSPRIANIISNGKKEEVSKYLENSFKFVWLLGLPMTLGLIAVSDSLVVWFLGEGYEQSALLIKIGALLIMAIGLNNVTGIQYLIPAKRQNDYTKSVVVAALLNLFLNFILIPQFKANGAIIASVIAEFSIVLIQFYYVRKDFDLKIVINHAWKYIVSASIMFIIVYVIGINLDNNVKTTFIQAFTGCVIYLIILVLLKDDSIYNVFNKLQRKFIKEKEN